MLALRWHDRGDLRLEDVDFESDLRPDEVEVEVAYCGICGSDLTEYKNGPFAIRRRPHVLSGQEPPVTLGHEFSGLITGLGPGVQGLAVGQRVSADACWRCGECAACLSGQYNRCPSGGSIGLASDGAFASRVRFPAYCAVPLSDGVSDRAGALLEPLAVGLHALDRGAATSASTVAVLGFGPIGACGAAVAAALGARVIVSEVHDARRARAGDQGYEVVAPTDDPRADSRRVREMSGGGVDVVLDCTGSAQALEVAPELTVRGGRVVVVGLPKTPPAIDAARLVLYERSVIGTLGYANDLPRVAELIASGALKTDALITGVVALTESPAEFHRLATDPGDDLKILVDVRA